METSARIPQRGPLFALASMAQNYQDGTRWEVFHRVTARIISPLPREYPVMPTTLRGSRYLLPALVVIAWTLLITPPASAIKINLERPGEREFVRDQANLLDADSVTKIKEIADKLLTETATPILVVTIESMASCGAADMRIETFATLLFDQWGIGVAEINGQPWNTGILLLVSKDDRKARIELGGGWGRREDALCKQIMDDQIIYHFKQKNFSQGILAGVQALEAMARKEPLPTKPRPAWHYLAILAFIGLAIFTAVSLARKGASGWAWVAWAAVFAVLGYILYAILTSSGSGGSGGGYSGGSFGGGSSGGGGATGSW